MNINVIYSIVLNLVICSLVNSSTSCSIFVSLNCSCFQSDSDLHLSLPIKSYSHLYCQGNLLNKKTFQPPFGRDFPYQNRFRTISIEFLLENHIEIHSNQFDFFSLLFLQTNKDAQIEISIRLNHFTGITLHKQSFTSRMFQEKHQNRQFSLHFIPKTLNNSTALDNQFKFDSDCFSGLVVSQMNVHIHTLKEDFSSLSFFEYLFNNTNIGELHFHGSIIRPGPSYLRKTFKGIIRSLTLHRRVDVIDSNTFPYYSSVYSYNIHSIEGHSIDLQSFLPLYNNFRGIELTKPRFEVSIDRLIPTLDSLSLDIEYLNEETLLSARHIYNFKLSSRLRRINPRVLDFLSNRLKNFDLSEIDLSSMTSDSRCSLIDFISKNVRRQINIILPRIESLTECDCARIILHHIQLMKKSNEDLLCSKQCRFSDCFIIREYFQDKYPLFNNDHHRIQNSNGKNSDLPEIDLFEDPIDMDMIKFLVNQTNIQQTTTTNRRRSTTTPLSIFKDSYSFNEEEIDLTKPKTTKFFSSFESVIGIVVVIVLIGLILLILFVVIRHKKQKHLQHVPVDV